MAKWLRENVLFWPYSFFYVAKIVFGRLFVLRNAPDWYLDILVEMDENTSHLFREAEVEKLLFQASVERRLRARNVDERRA